MKKILFIIPYIPYPLDSGGDQAFFNMVEYIRKHMSVSILLSYRSQRDKDNIAALQKIWNNVEFFTFNEKETHYPSTYLKILHKIKASVTRKIRREIRAARGKESTLYDSYKQPLSQSYLEYVAQVARKGFDFIQVEFFELIALGYILPKDAETIFVHHEIRYIRNENEMALFPHKTAYEEMLFQLGKDFERGALRQFRHIIALTDTDRDILKQFTGMDSIYSSPAVIPMNREENLHFRPVTTNRLTFLGSGVHYPNNDAIKWFVTEIAPILHRKNFHYSLDVIGSWGEKESKIFEEVKEINKAGYVDALHPFINGSIAIVPIRIGSGMRIKILDSVMSQVPVITTAKGVEGIDLTHEKECLIADSAEEFANAIIRLCQDTALQQQLVQQANRRMEELYQPEKMLEKRMHIYTSIQNQHTQA